MMKMSKNIVIYTGPSLNHDEALKILKAQYKNPIKRGDINEDIKNGVDVIGIIDGVFHQHPAVSHKEIILAMKKGIVVVGGSSMGALRASELDELGMIGLGYVYKQYSQGNISSDDDVAIVFSPEDNKQVSEALVTIEYNLNNAAKNRVISEEEKLTLIKTAKSIFYPNRTFNLILKESNLEKESADNLKNFLSKEYVNIKKEDAIAVLEYIKKL